MPSTNSTGTPTLQTTPTYPVMEAISNIKYAGFWTRVAANIIDSFVIAAPLSLMFVFSVESFSLILVWLYFVCMTVIKQQTLGKMAVGIKVLRVSGERPGLWQVIARETIGKLLSSSILGIGFLMICWTDKKQGLHDKIGGTIVVDIVQKSPKRTWIVILTIIAGLLAIAFMFGFVAVGTDLPSGF